jgi:stearoyl-CoA desaturase (delta-9 desaturase)
MKDFFRSFKQWFANSYADTAPADGGSDAIDWVRALPFILLNLSCLFVFKVGFSWAALITAVVLCYIRVFAIGAFYHRFFSHRAFKTNRFWQFIFALLACSAVQRGPLWWVTHHRQHHVNADTPLDAHSPVQHGFWWSHMGWFLSKKHYYYNFQLVKDLVKFPELIFLDRYDGLVPTLFALGTFAFGALLAHFAPSLHTNGWQMLVWGFCISTMMVFHITVSINSIAHKIGKQRFVTDDTSRNNLWLALLTLGEGWHNNHHHYPSTAKQGFHWWEIDITYYILKLFEKMGMIWDVKGVPPTILTKNLHKDKLV